MREESVAECYFLTDDWKWVTDFRRKGSPQPSETYKAKYLNVIPVAALWRIQGESVWRFVINWNGQYFEGTSPNKRAEVKLEIGRKVIEFNGDEENKEIAQVLRFRLPEVLESNG